MSDGPVFPAEAPREVEEVREALRALISMLRSGTRPWDLPGFVEVYDRARALADSPAPNKEGAP